MLSVLKSSCKISPMYHVLSLKSLPIRNPQPSVFKCKVIRPKVQNFHVSSPNKAIPPIVALLLRPLSKIAAMLFGRAIRKWWQKLPEEQKTKIRNEIRSKMSYIGAGGSIFTGGVLFYYLGHIKEEPITKRKRFIIYKDSQMKEIAQIEFENQVRTFRHDIIPISHPVYKRVAKVSNRILESNYDLEQIKQKFWTITVVDRPEITNAFVLPNGSIFLFTGMLNICTNDDQLAIVLAHEMSHAILSHMAENLSKVLFFETLSLIPLIILWAMLPDAVALFSQWLSTKLAEIVIQLPFSRYIEREADSLGLKLAAKACFDVREAPIFWAKMDIVSHRHSKYTIEWLSTHPSNERRQRDLTILLPQALKIREANHCYMLPPMNSNFEYPKY